MATEATTPTRICACGNTITPYCIGGREYWSSACPACLQQDAEREAEQRIEDNLVSIGLQRRYQHSDFDNLHDPKPPSHVIEAIRLYADELAAERESNGRGLYLWGPNGTGKTHLAVAVLRRVKQALFVNSSHLIDALKESYSTGEVCRVFESARWVKLLVLDDLGSERPTGHTQDRFYSLLSTRWDELLPTIVTSNFAPAELDDVVGARTASRILGSCLTIKIDGPDHRRFGTAAIG